MIDNKKHAITSSEVIKARNIVLSAAIASESEIVEMLD